MRRLLLLLLRNLFESEFSRQGRKQTEREEYEKEVEQEIARQREENARKRLQAKKNLQEAQDHSQKLMVDYVREAHELNPDTGPIPQPLPPNSDRSPEVKRGPRGGRYTEDRTKDGRPYRRYFWIDVLGPATASWPQRSTDVQSEPLGSRPAELRILRRHARRKRRMRRA